MNILITGSNGTIGTRLCQELLRKGHNVIGVDWKKNKWVKQVDKITLNFDLRDRTKFKQLPANFDLVIHLAANARVYNLVKEPNLARDNFETCFNVLEFSRKNNIKKFIFASSRETYGNSNKLKHSEQEAYTQNCESPYTASKIAGEALTHAYQQCYGIDFIIFRFSNVYGMYDDSDRVIPLFIKLTNQSKDLVVFGKEKLLDFTHIDDCVGGIIKGIESFEKARNDVYNLASGTGVSLVKVAGLIQQLMAKNNKLVIKKNRTGEVIKFIADITKARQKLGYQPKVPIKTGLRRAIQWYEKNKFVR